jgi:NDP-sugar pyrophosphorylase family protein
VLEGDRIREFLEKPQNPPSSFINSGLYVLHPAVFAYADFKKENLMIEKDIFPVLAKAGRLYGMRMAGGRWYDCGNIERWERAIKEW